MGAGSRNRGGKPLVGGSLRWLMLSYILRTASLGTGDVHIGLSNAPPLPAPPSRTLLPQPLQVTLAVLH